MTESNNPTRVFTEKYLDIFDIVPLDTSDPKHVLPPEEYRCMLDNIHRDDIVETYTLCNIHRGVVKQIIRDYSGIPVCLGIIDEGEHALWEGMLNFVSVDRVSKWTYMGPPNEWVDPARYTIEYRNSITEEEWITRSDVGFYDYERPKNYWEREANKDDEEDEYREDVPEGEEDYEDWYGDDWKDADRRDKSPVEEEMT